MLEVVIFFIDKVNAVLRRAVLCVLRLQDVLQSVALLFAAVLHQLHVVRKQNGHAAQVYQRADVVNFRRHLAGKRRVRADIAQVAGGIDRHTDEQRAEEFLFVDVQRRGNIVIIAFQREHRAIHCGIVDCQNAHTHTRARRALPPGHIVVELPFQRGGQFPQNKRADAVIPRAPGGHVGLHSDVQIHDQDGYRNAGQKPELRHLPRCLHKDAEQQQKHRVDRIPPPACCTLGEEEQI